MYFPDTGNNYKIGTECQLSLVKEVLLFYTNLVCNIVCAVVFRNCFHAGAYMSSYML